MRCVGAENPPCIRCTKSGRDCVVQASRRGQQSANSQARRQPASSSSIDDGIPRRRQLSPLAQSAQHAQQWSPAAHPSPRASFTLRRPTSNSYASPTSPSVPSPALPSVFSTSPLDVLEHVASQGSVGQLWSLSNQRSSAVRDVYLGNPPPEIAEDVLVELVDL